MDHHPDFVLEALDREVRRAVTASARWQERLVLEPLADGLAAEAPLGRHRTVAGKAAFDDTARLDVVASSTEWRTAIGRWIGALTVLRLTEAQIADEARVEAEELAPLKRDHLERVTFRRAWRGLVASANATEGGLWLDAIAGLGPRVAAARRERWSRAEEAAHRLGVDGLDALVGGLASRELDRAAETFLTRTQDLAWSVGREGAQRAGEPAFVASVLSAEARDAPEGWPARLTLRNVVETLRAPATIGRGIRVRVRLPEPCGGASFARGLEAFGEAYRRAVAVESRLPFALAVDPWFADAHRFGFAFGALPTMATYHRVGLGVVARLAGDQARVLTKTALHHARTLAMGLLLARRAARPDAAFFEELTARVYGAPLPRSLAGAFPRVRGDEAARVFGLLTTLPFLELLRDRYEDDWFRNPRAWDYLRGRAAGPARGLEAGEAPGPEALASWFEKALG